MALLHLDAQRVNHFFQRLHAPGPPGIVRGEDGYRQIQNVADRLSVGSKLRPALLRQGKSLIMELFGRLRHIDGMIGDPLKIIDAVQQNTEGPAVRLIEVPGGELHQIGAQHILVPVRLLLHGDDPLRAGLGIVLLDLHGQLEGVAGQIRHLIHSLLAQAHGEGRLLQKPLVQSLQGTGQGGLFLFPVGDGQLRQPDQPPREGEEHHCTADVEQAVDHGNVRRPGGVLQKGKMQERVAAIEYHSKEQSANQIKIKMDEGCPSGIFAGADGG